MNLTQEVVAEVLVRHAHGDSSLPQPLRQLCAELFARLEQGLASSSPGLLTRGTRLETWRVVEHLRAKARHDHRCVELIGEIFDAQRPLPPAPSPVAVADPPAAGASPFARPVFRHPTPTQSEAPHSGATGVVRILMLAASSGTAPDLRLDLEERDVKLALRGTKHRDRFSLEKAAAVRISDLQSHLLSFQPHILHFSGHGRQGVCLLEQDSDQESPVSARALANLVQALPVRPGCLVLNSCWSLSMAQTLLEVVDIVIGMKATIGDDAAIQFSVAFYRALASGSDVASAVDLGRNQIELARLGEEATPQLVYQRCDPRRVRFVGGSS